VERKVETTTSRRALGAWLLAAAVVLGVAGCSGEDEAPDPATAVQASYRSYAEAVATKDGAASAGLVSGTTLDHYSGLRDLALTADRATLAKERVVDQLAVLSMRANIPVATLRDADPRGLVAAAVQNQVISSGGAGAAALERVTVDGDTATASLGVAGGSQQVPMRFRREEGTWKVDLTALLTPAEDALGTALEQQRLTPETMLTKVMTTRVGAAKAQQLWTPLGR
jgi:hypothetical protein